jgi:hypothetical protein
MHPDAILRALRHVWVTLEPIGIPMAVIGGLALAAWKHPRATKDVDLLLGVAEDDSQPILRKLEDVGVRSRHSRIVRVSGLDVIQFLYEPPDAFIDVQIDLLLGDSAYFQSALQRRVPMQLPGMDVEIAVLACEDLILHKLLAGRIIDRADAAALLRANGSSLDSGYLSRWASNLGVRDSLVEIWEEAWPGQPSPPVLP